MPMTAPETGPHSRLLPGLVEELKFKFGEILPPVKFIVKDSLAKHAAASSLDQYLRVGIIKADGFVAKALEIF